jgi:hypothetical protein
MLVSGSYFGVLGAVPQLGRAIEPADDQASSGTAVVSHAFWRGTLGGDPEVLGRRLTVSRTEYVVSGVMPPGFSGHAATRVDVWVPMAAAMRDTPGWNLDAFRNVVSIIARVEPGDDVAAAAQASTALERQVSLVGLDGGEVAATDRRIAYALAGVDSVLVIGLDAMLSCAACDTGANRRFGRPLARRADVCSPGSCSSQRSSRRWRWPARWRSRLGSVNRSGDCSSRA